MWEFCDHRLISTPLLREAKAIGRIEVRGRENFVLEQDTNRVWTITQPLRLPADSELVEAMLKELANFLTKSSCFWKLALVTLPDASIRKWISAGLDPQSREKENMEDIFAKKN